MVGSASFFMLYRKNSGGKRSAAAAGGLSIRVVKRKPAIVEAIHKINFHAQQINRMRPVHDDADAIHFKYVVVGFHLVKTKDIRKSGAASALYTDAQTIVGWNIFLLTNQV